MSSSSHVTTTSVDYTTHQEERHGATPRNHGDFLARCQGKCQRKATAKDGIISGEMRRGQTISRQLCLLPHVRPEGANNGTCATAQRDVSRNPEYVAWDRARYGPTPP